MRRNVRALLARLEAESAGELAPERHEELERRNREAVERMEADPTGRLALEVLDRIGELHGIGADGESADLVRSALGYEAGVVALDLWGRFLEPSGLAREPPPTGVELMRRFVAGDDQEQAGATQEGAR